MIDFLEKKGCPIEDDLNAKLTDEQYSMLLQEFSSDKNLKMETEKRQAERQSIKERNQGEKEKKAAPKVTETVEKFAGDKKLQEQFKKEPVKAVEAVLGVDLPDDVVNQIVTAVKTKITADQLAGGLNAVKKLF